MLRSTRSATVVAVATAAALTVAGLFGSTAAFADDAPTPTPDPVVTDAPVEEPPAPPKPEGNHGAQHRDLAASKFLTPTTVTTAGNSFSHPVAVSGRWFEVDWDNTTATTQSGEPRKLGGGYYLRRTQWAKWKAPQSGYISLAAWTGDPNDDLGINVYTGSTLSNLHRVGTNDEQYDPVDGAGGSSTGPDHNAEILSLKVTAGKYYYIQVGSATEFSSDSNGSTTPHTDIQMFVSGSNYISSNDFFAGAAAIALGTGATVSKTVIINGSTMEEWEPSDNDETADLRIGSLWYKWSAPQDGLAALTTCSFLDSYTVAVFTNYGEYSGTGYGDLAAIGFDEGDNGGCGYLSGGGGLNFHFEKGTTYFFQIAKTSIGGINRAGSMTLTAYFEQPYIEKVSPSSGSHLGGNTVTITGQSLDVNGTPVVKFGSTTAHIISVTSTQIKVKAPAHSVGTVNVSVKSGTVISNLKHYKYL